MRLVRLEIELDSPIPCTVTAKGPDFERSVELQDTKSGRRVYKIYLPDSREEGDLGIALRSNGAPLVSGETKWAPARHWEVDLIHMSHHDWATTANSRLARLHDSRLLGVHDHD